MFSKMISVLVPTRKRIQQLSRMLESFYQTVHDDSAELVFRIDQDDQESQTFLISQPWTVVVGPRYDGYRSFAKFTDELRRAAVGDVFMVGNDDMVFQTPDWPEKLLAVANQYPDGLFDLSVETHNKKVVPWSTVSRLAVDRLGHIHDERLYWGDVYLRDIFKAFDRVIHVPAVTIEHAWMGWTPDETFRDAKQDDARNWSPQYWELHRACVLEAIAKLKAVPVCQ